MKLRKNQEFESIRKIINNNNQYIFIKTNNKNIFELNKFIFNILERDDPKYRK
jgi:hypothetical protein